MASSGQIGKNLSAIQQAKSFVFCFYLFFSKCQIKRFGDFPNIPKFPVYNQTPLFAIYGVCAQHGHLLFIER